MALMTFPSGKTYEVPEESVAQTEQDYGAYVGTGQVVDMIQAESIAYDYARKKATEKNDSVARDELEALAPYPTGLHQDHAKRPIARKWARYYGWNGAIEVARTRTALMTTPEYTLMDIYRYLRGSIFSMPLASELIDQSLQPAFLSRTFKVPIFFLSGATDAYTPIELVEEYFQSILADEKKHVIFKNSGHWPMLSEFDRYLHVLVQDVRPHLI
jgi:proline iminopeptidase